MSWAWSGRAALGGALLASLAGGCRSNDASSGAMEPGGGDAGDDAGAIAITFDVPATVACAGTSDVCAGPSRDVAIGIDAATSEVTLGLEGDYADSALDVDDVPLPNGHGTVTLHTASKSTTFRLVARDAHDPTQTASIGVAVSATGFAQVRATPRYDGHRWGTTSKMYVTVSTKAACSAIAGSPLPDTEPWTTTPRNTSVLLTVPAGMPLAVDVRVGHYAYGCSDVDPLTASATAHDVAVSVYDVPIALALTNLDASFAFTDDAGTAASWQATLAAAGAWVGNAFYGAGSEATALLDGVRATIASASDQATFDQARQQGGWDTKAASWLQGRAPSLHDRATAWLASAEKTAPGPLAVHLGAGAGGTAPVTIVSFGGLSGAEAAIQTPAPFGWTADPDDTVHLSGEIDVATRPLVAALADAPARGDVAQSTDVPSALALAVDVAGLAQALVGSGVAYGGCAAACTADAFRTAIVAAWTTASAAAANDGDVAKVTLTASAPGTTGDHAEPLGFTGAWIGQASGAGVAKTFALKGDVTAQPPAGVQ